jgi:protocatechuate 3,4-dioxygenase beta subunit
MPETLFRSRLCFAVLFFASALCLTAQPSVLGTVFDPAGQPVAGAQIDLMPVLSGYEAGRLRLAGQRDPSPVAAGKSDANGRYLVRATAVGVFKVVIRGEGRLPMQCSPLSLVEDRELPPVALARAEEIRTVVRDTSGQPLVDAWVFAASSEERREIGQGIESWRPDFRLGRTGADGSITFSRLKEEQLDVSVLLPGRAEHRRLARDGETITVAAGRAAVRPLRVVSAKGEPLQNVLVRAGELAWPIGLTDTEGRIRIAPAPEEAGKIWLLAPDGRLQSADLTAERADSEMTLTLADPLLVSGRVTDQETGQPLAGALIRRGLDPGLFLLTDTEGRYRLASSPSQSFPLHVQAPRHLSRSARVTSTHLRLGRAPTLALPRSAALRGSVVDAQGAPLSGAAVFALPDLAGSSEPPLGAALGRAATDGSGRFELRPLRAGGFYEVRAIRPGYLPASVKVSAPAAARDAPLLKIALSPARAVRGRVQDTSGRPVAGAEVRLTPARSPGARRSPEKREEPEEGDGSFASHTDLQGRFSIAQAPAERMDLTARQRGYATGHVAGLRLPQGTGPADLGTIILQFGARLQGRVIDRAGKPVTGAEIHVVESVDHLEQENTWIEREAPDAIAGADGSFLLEDLPQATPLHLLVRASGHLPAGVRGVRLPAATPLLIRLEPAAALRGQVVDEKGAPVAGARVVLTWQPTAPENPERQTGVPIERSDIAGRDGRFEIRDAPAGRVRLAVSAQGYVAVEGFEAAVPWLDPTRELTLTLEKGAVLTGRIATAEGKPVAGARVTAEGASEVSDDEGAYTVDGVSPGRTEVHVSHPLYKLFRREMVIQPGINPLDVTFDDGVEVSGRVMDSRGDPVAGARVALLRQVRKDWREYRERTGEDGTFRFAAVAKGLYRLEGGGAGYATAERKRPVIVEGDPVDGLDIVLEQGGSITGRVLGLSTDQLAQVEVGAQGQNGETVSALVDADGRYELRHLSPGDYLVRADLEAGQRHVQARVPVPPGNEEAVRDLLFTPRLTLSGQVLYDEEPLAEAKISIRGSRWAVERSIQTDYQGGFRFEDLEPDTYWLGLSHSRELLVHNENIELSEDREVAIRLRPATVSGVVTDVQSQGPISGALVILRHREGSEFVITDSVREDGTFSIHRVPAGLYVLTVRASGYSPAEQKLDIASGQGVAGLEVGLAPTRGLELTVRLASGHIPEQVHLRIVSLAGAIVLTETRPVDASGKVVLSTVPEGRSTLLLSAPGGAAAAFPVTVPGGPIPVTLLGAGSLQIRVPALAATDLRATAVLSAAGQPFWTVLPGGGLQSQWQLVGGKASIGGIPAGLWQVRVEAPDGRIWTGQAATPGPGETEITLE